LFFQLVLLAGHVNAHRLAMQFRLPAQGKLCTWHFLGLPHCGFSCLAPLVITRFAQFVVEASAGFTAHFRYSQAIIIGYQGKWLPSLCED
jgi:hypothetical protein